MQSVVMNTVAMYLNVVLLVSSARESIIVVRKRGIACVRLNRGVDG